MGATKSKKTSGQPSGPRIFVVDDEPMLLELAAKILGRYQVRTFSDPEKALAAYSAAQAPPDLVITDFAMHKMDGLDLIRECRRLHPKQKIVLLSGTVDQTIYTGTGVRPDRFLEKPYKPGELAELVQEILAD
jgi:CheY-like chemotaxis protein